MPSPPRPLLASIVAAALFGACIAVPEGQGIPKKLTEQGDSGVAPIDLDSSLPPPSDARSDLALTDPHMVIGVDPPHGPYSGGQRALVRGNGFAPDARVWFGSVEVPSADLLRIDSARLQVSVPPGGPGPVAVTVRNGDDDSTSRTLEEGYTYDAWFASPASGPTSGGTIVTVSGKGTSWVEGTVVKLGGAACQALEVLSATELRCTTPAHTPGSVSLSIRNPGEEERSVDDAFVFADSDNGFKGGLSGLALSGTMRVAAYNNYTGDPVVNATVILGDSLGTALQKKTDSAGIAVFSDAGLVGSRSVTIAKTCFEPGTFVDVPVDTVTAYLNPVMSPDCGADAGDVPPVGGKGATPATIQGQLVWFGGTEFKRATWTNVPAPKSEAERQVAYLFVPSSDPTSRFWLPDSAVAVTPESDGTIGYVFSYSTYAGNVTLYALAGIENRSVSPATFVPYAFGIVRGVSAIPGETTSDVFIPMTKVLDQAVSMTVSPPLPGPKGPDRVAASVAVKLGADGYAIFPNAAKSVPIASLIPVQFVGLPGLTDSLAGSTFVASASAVTGANGGPPMSVVASYATTDASQVVPIDGFVQVPVLETPQPGTKFDGTHISFSTAPGATSIDVSVIRITAGGGLMEWLVAVPPGKTNVELPDLSSIGLGLTAGPVDIAIYCGHALPPFDYGSLVYRQLASRGWSAYAYDVFHAYY